MVTSATARANDFLRLALFNDVKARLHYVLYGEDLYCPDSPISVALPTAKNTQAHALVNMPYLGWLNITLLKLLFPAKAREKRPELHTIFIKAMRRFLILG